MSTFVTRRAAFGIAATAAFASLTACASDIRPLSDPSVLDTQRVYKGELKFNNYESRGTYVPATSSMKAENPPKPVPPAEMKAKTTEGMYAAIGFWLASFNYLIITGDIEPLRLWIRTKMISTRPNLSSNFTRRTVAGCTALMHRSQRS